MVTAEIERSSAGVVEAFEDRDVGTIALTGGLAVVGFSIAMTAGGVLSRAVVDGSWPPSRTEALVMGVGAMAVAAGGVKFLPAYLAGPLAIGSMVAMGALAMFTVFGSGTEAAQMARAADHSRELAARSPVNMSSVSGCSSCGSSKPVTVSKTAPSPAGGGFR